MKRFLFISTLLLIVILGGLYLLRFYRDKSISPIRGEFVTVEDQSIYITDQGEGRPVFFLPGFLIHSDTFFKIASAPPPGYRYITIDWPGLGFSKKSTSSALTPADLSLLLKFLLDKLNLSRVALVGHDMGGGVAMICAARFPGLINGLLLIAPDSSHGEAADILGPWWHWPVINILWATVRLDRGFVRWYMKNCWSQDNENWANYVERYYRPLLFQNACYNLLQSHRGRRKYNYLPYEERIEVKTNVVWGEQDLINPYRNGQALVQSLAHSELTLISGAGHLPQEEKTDEVAAIIKNFIQSLDYSNQHRNED